MTGILHAIKGTNFQWSAANTARSSVFLRVRVNLRVHSTVPNRTLPNYVSRDLCSSCFSRYCVKMKFFFLPDRPRFGLRHSTWNARRPNGMPQRRSNFYDKLSTSTAIFVDDLALTGPLDFGTCAKKTAQLRPVSTERKEGGGGEGEREGGEGEGVIELPISNAAGTRFTANTFATLHQARSGHPSFIRGSSFFAGVDDAATDVDNKTHPDDRRYSPPHVAADSDNKFSHCSATKPHWRRVA